MTPAAKQINVGDVRSVLYTFVSAGDVLAMHEHAPGTEHLTAVLQGAVICRGPGDPPAWMQPIGRGEIYDLPAGAHEIEATAPSTMIWNVQKGTQP